MPTHPDQINTSIENPHGITSHDIIVFCDGQIAPVHLHQLCLPSLSAGKQYIVTPSENLLTLR